MYAIMPEGGQYWEIYEDQAPMDVATMQKLVGGYFETLKVRDFSLWFNEDGRAKELVPTLAIIIDGSLVTLVGNVVVTRTEGVEVVNLTQDDVDELERIADGPDMVLLGGRSVPFMVA